MNAPWKPGGIAHREPFAAYVCDEITAEALRPIADELGCSLAQLSLAWCTKNPNVSTVITGASKPTQVAENFAALDVIAKLDDEVMARIDEAVKS